MALGRQGAVSSWLFRARAVAFPRFRLFCFPFAGGGASAYRVWCDLLDDADVCGIQLPGHETRVAEPLATHVDQVLGSGLIDAVCPLLDAPFAVFGHSMGGLIAFEFVRRLRALRLPMPVHFFVSGQKSPRSPRSQGQVIHTLPEAEFMARLRTLQGTPEAILADPELMSLYGPVLRADFALLETYRYVAAPPLDVPISAFCGTRDSEATADEMRPWAEETSAPFRFRLFPGNHFFIQPQRAAVLRELRGALDPYIGPSASTALA